MLENGMPMEQLDHLNTFGERNRQAVNAEVALLVMLDSAARVTQETSPVAEPTLRGELARSDCAARGGVRVGRLPPRDL